MGNTKIPSHVEEGRVASRCEDGTLVIYILGDDELLDSGYTPIELSEELAVFCGIKNIQDASLLTQILAQSNHKFLQADLERRARGDSLARLDQQSTPLTWDQTPAIPSKGDDHSERGSTTTHDGQAELETDPDPVGDNYEAQKEATPSASQQRPGDSRVANEEDGSPEESAIAETTKANQSPVESSDVHEERLSDGGTSQQEAEDRGAAVRSGGKDLDDDIPAARREGKAGHEVINAGDMLPRNGAVAEQESTSEEALLADRHTAQASKTVADGTDAPEPVHPSNANPQVEASDREPELGGDQKMRALTTDDQAGRKHSTAEDIGPDRSLKREDLEAGREAGTPEENQGANPNGLVEADAQGADSKEQANLTTGGDEMEAEASIARTALDEAEPRSPTTIFRERLESSKKKITEARANNRKPDEALGMRAFDNEGNLGEGSKDDMAVLISRHPSTDELSTGHRESRSHVMGSNAQLLHNRPRSAHSSHIVPRGDRGVDSLSRTGRRRTRDEFVNMNLGMVLTPSPMTIFVGEDTKETRYFGELYVSRFLGSFLGSDAYDPKKHWTSPLRTRNGHASFTATSPDWSTFTISETRGKLRESVIRGGRIDGALLEESCTFHIEVCATNNDLHSPFILSNSQYAKAKRMTVGDDNRASQVYILARVYKVQAEPGIALYADPWRLHHERLISLESESSYQGTISTAAPAILVQKFASFATETHEIYRGLDIGPGEIRLLKLELDHNDEGAPLRGKLMCISVDSPPPFWAISYVLGPQPTQANPIYFETDKGKIPITESLATCLRCLRRRDDTALLWADAVCINQDNNIEKSMQVRRMGSLYGVAERVIIWMGSDRDEDHGAIDSLVQLQGQSESPRPEDAPHEDALWKRIDTFLRRPWFTRTWTIQELVFGSDVRVLCGNAEIGWDDMMKGIVERENQLNRGRQRFLLSSGRALALNRTREHFKTGRKLGFLELLEMFFYTRSSKPRDKLFALLNMAYDTGREHEAFDPDYDSDEQVILVKYAKAFVKSGLVLDLLYRAGSDKSSDFCSWIPDLMNHRRNDHYPPTISTWEAAGSEHESGFRAGAPFPPRAEVRDPDDPAVRFGIGIGIGSHLAPVLTVRGNIVDSIQGCHPLKIAYFSTVLEDLRRYISYLKFYPRSGKNWRDEVLVKSLIGDAVRPQTTSRWTFVVPLPSQQAEPEKWPLGFEKEVLALQPDRDAREYVAKSPESQFWQTAAAFTQRIPRAAFCISRKGYAGIVPGAAGPEDVIFMAHGAKVPFVLRKRTGTGHYTLVGECYVHGLMYYWDSGVAELKEEEVSLV